VLTEELQLEQLLALHRHLLNLLQSKTESQIALAQAVLDALPAAATLRVTADTLAALSEDQLAEMLREMSEDNEGSDAVELLKRLLTEKDDPDAPPSRAALLASFGAAPPASRLGYLEAIGPHLTKEERSVLLSGCGVSHTSIAQLGLPNPAGVVEGGGGSSRRRQRSAGGGMGGKDGGKGGDGGSKRGTMMTRKGSGGSVRSLRGGSGGSGGGGGGGATSNVEKAAARADAAAASAPEKAAAPAPAPGQNDDDDDDDAVSPPDSARLGDTSADHKARGVVTGATLQQLLLRPPPDPPHKLETAELLRLIAAAYCHRLRYKADMDQLSTRHGLTRPSVTRPREFGETLWEYLTVAEDRRSAALQALANLNHTMELDAGATDHGLSRVRGFRALSGLHPPAEAVWGWQQADFYLHAMQELLTLNTADRPTPVMAELATTLSSEMVYVELPQAIAALRALVRDAELQSEITTQTMEMASEEVESGRHPTPAVSLDWILDTLMTDWSDANRKTVGELQRLFAQSDTNGDGVMSLSEFQAMLRGMPTDGSTGVSLPTSEREAFAIYSECISQSEQVLGHDTDSILPEVFVQVGLAKELLPGAHTIFHLTKPEAASSSPSPSRRRATVAGGEVKVPRRKSAVTGGSPSRQGIGNGLGAMMTASNSVISDASDGSPAPGRTGQSPRVPGSRKSVAGNLSFRE